MRHVGPRAAPRDRASPPEERSLTDPKFIGSFPRADALLDPPLPEVAMLGRSNVGKSSLLNALVGRRIAKTSGTPGKTRALNVFLVPDLSTEHGAGSRRLRAPCSVYFLDLPGYGYARAGKAQRAAFRGLLKHALVRERLRGVVWLLDIRHPPSVDDRAMQDVLVEGGMHVLAALTKSDKLSQAHRRTRECELRDELGLPEDQIVVTSAVSGEGIVELREAIAGLIRVSE
ncbi:MAG TPA: ribosome biogenesis GTP-binding protein YihA/YsxC [Gemmatimonadales bacterium]|nr:ribosome biogenesis GTP-binding protein YihA/YsxC [Gemmatimonadales bacterium]